MLILCSYAIITHPTISIPYSRACHIHGAIGYINVGGVMCEEDIKFILRRKVEILPEILSSRFRKSVSVGI